MKVKLFFLLAFLFSLLLNATHNRSGEIYYKRVAPFTTVVGTVTVPVYTYSITVVKYTDYGPSIADRCTDTVYFGDGQKGVAPRINGGTNLNCGCTGTLQCGQLILQQNGYTIKKSIYSILHTYAGTGSYLISSTDPNRNPGIHNIPNSSSVPFYIESLLVINPLTGTNSSPVFASDPINQATLGLCFYDNLNASDADGDSLSYELIPCAAPGYFYPETGGGSISMNQSGTFTWCVPQFIAQYQVAYKVSEWRKNGSGVYVSIGYVIRDRQILVKAGTVAIEYEQSQNEFSFYPNPLNSLLNIKWGENVPVSHRLFVTDVNGKEWELKGNRISEELLQFDFQNLESGIYVLRAEMGEKRIYQKIVKE